MSEIKYFPGDRNPHTAILGNIEAYLDLIDDTQIKFHLDMAMERIKARDNFERNLNLLLGKIK